MSAFKIILSLILGFSLTAHAQNGIFEVASPFNDTNDKLRQLLLAQLAAGKLEAYGLFPNDFALTTAEVVKLIKVHDLASRKIAAVRAEVWWDDAQQQGEIFSYSPVFEGDSVFFSVTHDHTVFGSDLSARLRGAVKAAVLAKLNAGSPIVAKQHDAVWQMKLASHWVLKQFDSHQMPRYVRELLIEGVIEGYRDYALSVVMTPDDVARAGVGPSDTTFYPYGHGYMVTRPEFTGFTSILVAETWTDTARTDTLFKNRFGVSNPTDCIMREMISIGLGTDTPLVWVNYAEVMPEMVRFYGDRNHLFTVFDAHLDSWYFEKLSIEPRY